jgi:hypothetical protein
VGDGPPRLKAGATAPAYSSGGLSLQLPTTSGKVYLLEYDSTLTGTNWNGIRFTPGNGALQTLLDPAATNSARFYRVRQW